MAHTTLGRTFQAPDGKTYRPSLFVTLTLPSYGKVKDGAPVDPDTYDYARAAGDALHFSKLVDRFVQNLRRVAGFDVQYFASVEPQKRLAPHLHMAIRGTLPRAEIKQIAAATYHQVWWPSADQVVFDGDHLPVWEEEAGYLDPDTGAEHKQDRRTWVLEALGRADEPTDPHRYIWRPVPAGDANVPPLAMRLLRSVRERQGWRAHMAELQARADGQNLSATEHPGRAA